MKPAKEEKETNEKEIEEAIIKIAGEEGMKIYFLLKEKQNISEFVLSDKLNLTINQIRNILYKFDKFGLVSSTRKKDRKKGWYIYYWTFNPYKAEDLIISIKKRKLEKYKTMAEKEESNIYYVCPKGCMKLNFENAFENQFQCLECGQLMQPEESEKIISKLKKEIEILEEEIRKLVKKREERVFEEIEEKKKPKKKIKKKPKKLKKEKKKPKKFKKKSKKKIKKIKVHKKIKKKLLKKKKLKKKIKKIRSKKKSKKKSTRKKTKKSK